MTYTLGLLSHRHTKNSSGGVCLNEKRYCVSDLVAKANLSSEAHLGVACVLVHDQVEGLQASKWQQQLLDLHRLATWALHSTHVGLSQHHTLTCFLATV